MHMIEVVRKIILSVGDEYEYCSTYVVSEQMHNYSDVFLTEGGPKTSTSKIHHRYASA